jgi:photosystem I subunit 3
MKTLLGMLLIIFIWLNLMPDAAAAGNTHLVPCHDSAAFLARMEKAPQSYYFDQPYQSYSENLLCGEEGLPHLQLRLDRAVDVAIPFGIFFYFAGFVGWSGRSYLIASKRRSKPEENEIFVDIPLAIKSFTQGLLWPLLFVREFSTGQLTTKDSELSVSPR